MTEQQYAYGVRWDGPSGDEYDDRVELAYNRVTAEAWIEAESEDSSMWPGVLVRRPLVNYWEEVTD